jgi:hypothetical protein
MAANMNNARILAVIRSALRSARRIGVAYSTVQQARQNYQQFAKREKSNLRKNKRQTKFLYLD